MSPTHLQENIFYLQGQQDLKTLRYDQAIVNFGKALEVNPQNPDIYLDRAYAYLESGKPDYSLDDFEIYQEQKNVQPTKSTIIGDCVDFSTSFVTGVPKGAVESGKQLGSFAGNAITHPIDTLKGINESFCELSKLARSQEWKVLRESLAPEVCELVDRWEELSVKARGEKAGYIVGKYGADIVIPGVAAKAISQGVKGAKELVEITANLEKSQKVFALEALAGSEGKAGSFAGTANFSTAEKFAPYSSELLSSIKEASSLTTKDDILNILKPNGKWIGTEGTSSYIRLLQGGPTGGREVFNELTKNGTITLETRDIIISKLPGDIYITFRPISTSGPATIDIKLPDIKNTIKMKFVGEK